MMYKYKGICVLSLYIRMCTYNNTVQYTVATLSVRTYFCILYILPYELELYLFQLLADSLNVTVGERVSFSLI